MYSLIYYYIISYIYNIYVIDVEISTSYHTPNWMLKENDHMKSYIYWKKYNKSHDICSMCARNHLFNIFTIIKTMLTLNYQ